MANNYVESSSFLKLEKDQLKKAQDIIDRVTLECEDEEGYMGIDATVEDTGVWFCHDESINPEHLAVLASALIEELEIDKPFFASWAYTCSKPRIDEFGGGAIVVERGKDTIWVDAEHEARKKWSARMKLN